MDKENITVVYKWTAKPGQLDTLSEIYDGVTNAMEANEPGALAVHVYTSKEDNAIYVRDVFADAGALGYHLQETAAPHFPNLLEVAIPGTFYFFGDVPVDMQAAARSMGLAAEFSSHATGFDR